MRLHREERGGPYVCQRVCRCRMLGEMCRMRLTHMRMRNA